jgi:hypothetical protein
MKRFAIILPFALAACAADQYHADPGNPPTESVYAANRFCGFDSIRFGEVNPTGFAALAGGALGGAAGGAAAGAIVGASPANPHMARWNACMAQHGWLSN